MPRKKKNATESTAGAADSKSQKKHVLVAILGTAPAILTEAVWALAMQRNIVPDRIVVFTTKTGKQKFADEVIKKGVWKKLAKTLAAAGHDVRGKLVFDIDGSVSLFKNADDRLIDDLRTREDNLLAANMMMHELNRLATDGDCVIHALLSGGRKTMTALFFSCMCLQGRDCDRIYHVLAEEPYEQKLEPPFYFPEKGVSHTLVQNDGKGKKKSIVLKSDKVKINLFEVPFVYMGEWAEQRCRAISKNLSYENLINAVQKSFNRELFPDRVVLDFTQGKVEFDGKPMKPSEVNFMVLAFLLQGYQKQDVITKMNELKVYMRDEDEDRIEFRDDIMRKMNWLYKMGWRGKEKDIQQKFLHDDKDKDVERLLSHDFSLAQGELKKDLIAAQQDSLFHLLFEGNLRANGGVFDPLKQVVCRMGNMPEGLMEYFFPEDAPVKLKRESV